MAAVGLAVFPRRHANDLLALHLGLEAAAHPAIGAGGDDRLNRQPHLVHVLLFERRSGASLHAGAAGDAVAFEERVVLPRHDARIEPATLDREGECTLDFLAGTHAPAAHYAF